MAYSINSALLWAKQQLSHLDTAQLDAQILLAQVLGKQKEYLLTWPEEILNKPQKTRYENLVIRRKNHEPVAYLLGEKEFWSLTFRLNDQVLIPRPETEILVEQALLRIPPKDASWHILDIGTGCGIIALCLAKERPSCQITATDISEPALAIAKLNGEQLNINNVEFIHSDLFAALGNKKFNMLVSNPPYVAENDCRLRQELKHEPADTLTAGSDGLDYIRPIIEQAKDFLTLPGLLLLEHGFDQRQKIEKLLRQAEFEQIKMFKDLAGIPRCICAAVP